MFTRKNATVAGITAGLTKMTADLERLQVERAEQIEAHRYAIDRSQQAIAEHEAEVARAASIHRNISALINPTDCSAH